MGRPRIKYNSVSNRWEIRGKAGELKFAVDDGNVGVPIRFISFVGTTPAVASMNFNVPIVATISGASDLQRNDKVFGLPRNALAVGNAVGISHFHVPSNSLLHVTLHAIGTAAGSLSAMGWDIFAIRTQ